MKQKNYYITKINNLLPKFDNDTVTAVYKTLCNLYEEVQSRGRSEKRNN